MASNLPAEVKQVCLGSLWYWFWWGWPQIGMGWWWWFGKFMEIVLQVPRHGVYPTGKGRSAQWVWRHCYVTTISSPKTSLTHGILKSSACGISLLLDSHLANIQQFLLKVCQMGFPRNSICSGNSCKIPFAPDSDSTPNLPGIPPCVWCTTKWHHKNTKQKSRLLVWMTRSHAMSNFPPFSARCSRYNVATSTPSASLFN